MRNETKTALQALTFLASIKERMKVRDLAMAENLHPAILAKTLQRLAYAGLLKSSKGPTGGFELSGSPTIAQVMKACGEDIADLPYVGAEAFGTALLYRKSTTMEDLAKKPRGRGVVA